MDKPIRKPTEPVGSKGKDKIVMNFFFKDPLTVRFRTDVLYLV